MMGLAAARATSEAIRDLLARDGRAAVIFASAPSQNEFLAALRQEPGIDWPRITAFHLDEYVGIAPAHPASFRRFLVDRLFAHVKVAAFHGLDGQAKDLAAECSRYAGLLRQKAPALAILGVGENGHLAFMVCPPRLRGARGRAGRGARRALPAPAGERRQLPQPRRGPPHRAVADDPVPAPGPEGGGHRSGSRQARGDHGRDPGPGHHGLPRLDPAPPPRRDAVPRRLRLRPAARSTEKGDSRPRAPPSRFCPYSPSRPSRQANTREPSLVELLTSAGEYVLAYEDAFRVVVAEEVYVQRLRASPGGPVQQTRRLISDVAFVRAPGTALPWWLLRDVYEADGGAVRDREARLERLLVESPAVGLERARAIAEEGARFNLGRSHRNFNVPTLVLAFLHPSLQPRFSFEQKGRTTIEGRSFVEIAFRELGAPTVIRGPEAQPDVPAAGRVWIHEGRDGTVGRTELVLDVAGDGIRTRATLATEYRPYRALTLWVPVEMRDRLQTELAGARGRSGSVEVVEGLASYRGFRQAGVSMEEELRLPGPEAR
jgi:hypothetical protein